MAGEDGAVQFTFMTNVGDVVGQIVDAMAELDSALASTGDTGDVGTAFLGQVDKIVAGVRERGAQIEKVFTDTFNGVGTVAPNKTLGGYFNVLVDEAKVAGEAIVRALSPATRALLPAEVLQQARLAPVEAVLNQLTVAEAALKARYNALNEIQRQGLEKFLSAGQITRARNNALNFLTEPGVQLAEPTTTLYRAEGGRLPSGEPVTPASESYGGEPGGRSFYDNPNAALEQLRLTGGQFIRMVQVLTTELAQFSQGIEGGVGQYLLSPELAQSSIPISQDIVRSIGTKFDNPVAADTRARIEAEQAKSARDTGDVQNRDNLPRMSAAEEKLAAKSQEMAEKAKAFIELLDGLNESGNVLHEDTFSIADAVKAASGRTGGVQRIGPAGTGATYSLPQFTDEAGNNFFQRGETPGNKEMGIPAEPVLARVEDPEKLAKIAGQITPAQFEALPQETQKFVNGLVDFFRSQQQEIAEVKTRSRDTAAKQKAADDERQRALGNQVFGKILDSDPKLQNLPAKYPGARTFNGYAQLEDVLYKQTSSGLKVVEGNQELYTALKSLRNQLQSEARNGDHVEGAADGFLGGLFGRGFETGHGFDPKSALSNLAGTAGVLARYGGEGQLLFGAQAAAGQPFKDANAYNAALVPLRSSLEAVGVAQISLNQAITSGNALGVDNVSTVEITTKALGAYRDEVHNSADANQVMSDSVKAVGDAMVLTGQDAKTVQTQLIAATQGFRTGSKGQTQINDAYVNASRYFGADPAQVLDAVSTSAAAAAQSGTTPEQLANIVALIQARTGDSGSTISGSLDRLVARGDNSQFLGALSEAGIKQTGDLQQEIIGLSGAYNRMSASGKAAFETSLGGARNIRDLLPLLQDGGQLSDAYAFSLEHLGAASEEAHQHLQTVAGQLSVLKALFVTLATNIGNSGIFAPIELLVGSLKPALQLLNQLVAAYNKLGDIPGIGGPLKDVIAFSGELLLAGAAINKFKVAKAKAAGEDEKDAAGEVAGTKNASTAAQDANNAAKAEGVTETEALVAAERASITTGEDVTAALAAETAAQEALNAAKAEGVAVAEASAAANAAGGFSPFSKAKEGYTAAKEAEAAKAAEAGAVVSKFGRLGVAAEGAAAGLGGLIAGINPMLLALIAAPVVIESFVNGISNEMSDIRLNQNPVVPGDYNGLIAQASDYANQANADRQSAHGIFGHVEDSFFDVLDKLPGISVNNIETHAAIDAGKASNLAGLAAQLKHEQDIAAGETGNTAVFGGSLSANTLQTAVAAMQAAGQSAGQMAQTINLAFRPASGAAYLSPHSNLQIGDSLTNTLTSHLGAGSTTLSDKTDLTNAINDGILHIIGSASNQGGFLTQDQITKIADFVIGFYVPKSGETKQKQDQDKAYLRKKINEALATGLGVNGLFTPGDQATSTAVQQLQAQNAQNVAQQTSTLTGSAVQGAQAGLAILNETLAEAAANGTALDPGALATRQQLLNQLAQAFKADADSAADLAASLLPSEDAVGQAIAAYNKALGDLRADLQTNDVNQQREDQAAVNQAREALRQAAIAQTVAGAQAFHIGSNGLPDTSSPVDVANPLDVDQANVTAALTRLRNTTEFDKNGEVTSAYSQAQTAFQQALHQQLADQVATTDAVAALNVRIGDAVGTDIQKYNSAIRKANTVDRTNVAARAADLIAARDASAQSYIDQAALEDSRALSGIHDKRNTLALDRQTVKNDTRDINAYVAAGYDPLGKPVQDLIAQRDKDREQLANDQVTQDNARLQAMARLGNTVSQSKAAVEAARNNLSLLNKNDAGYWDAYKQMQTAKYQLAEANLAKADEQRQLSIDLTNPLLVARDAVTKARNQLVYDEKHHTGDLTADRLALVQAQNSASKTAFDQEFQAQQTKFQLQQESAQQYLQYLENERNSLERIKHKTYEQQQELNEVNQAILSLNDSLSGQFNLGDISLPTVYDVRRQIASASAATTYVDSATTTNNVTINGVDITQVIKYVNSILGPAATKTKASNTGRKT